MMKFFEGGANAKKAAEEGLDFINDRLKREAVEGPLGEQVVYEFGEITLIAPVPRPNIV